MTCPRGSLRCDGPGDRLEGGRRTRCIVCSSQRIEALELRNHELTESLELARTYKGIEAQGCPLCTYKEGVFIAQCSLHRQIHALQGRLEGLLPHRDGTIPCSGPGCNFCDDEEENPEEKQVAPPPLVIDMRCPKCKQLVDNVIHFCPAQ